MFTVTGSELSQRKVTFNKGSYCLGCTRGMLTEQHSAQTWTTHCKIKSFFFFFAKCCIQVALIRFIVAISTPLLLAKVDGNSADSCG